MAPRVGIASARAALGGRCGRGHSGRDRYVRSRHHDRAMSQALVEIPSDTPLHPPVSDRLRSRSVMRALLVVRFVGEDSPADRGLFFIGSSKSVRPRQSA